MGPQEKRSRRRQPQKGRPMRWHWRYAERNGRSVLELMACFLDNASSKVGRMTEADLGNRLSEISVLKA